MAEAPKKRGRPRLTEAEKKRRAAEKAARPRNKPGPKPGSKRKATPKAKPAPVVMLNDEGIGGEETKRGRGNPGKWKPEYVEQARKLAEAGFTDKQMADWFEISTVTFYAWTARHPDFLNAIKISKKVPDDKIERTLFHRACGYSFESEKIFNNQGEIIRVSTVEHVPPDPTSMIFWLKNRRPDKWRDKKEVDLNPHEDWLSKVAALEGAD